MKQLLQSLYFYKSYISNWESWIPAFEKVIFSDVFEWSDDCEFGFNIIEEALSDMFD